MVDLLRYEQGIYAFDAHYIRPQLAAIHLIVENDHVLEGEDEDHGAAVAIVRIAAVRPFTESDMAAACASRFEDGWLAWELEDVRPLAAPIPAVARRGIHEVALPDGCL